MIQTSLIKQRKEVSLKRNENQISCIIYKLEAFNYKVKFRYFWKTGNVTSLVVLKNLVIHKENVIYKGICSYSKFNVVETKWNSEVRMREHCSTNKMS